MIRTDIAFASIALAGLLSATSPACAQSAAGVWLTKDQDAHIRIGDCGGSVCGTIVWLKEPIDKATGKPATDEHNPDVAKRSRPLMGVQVMYGMKPAGPGKWTGHLYNADDGKTYEGSLTVLGSNSVHVEGCVMGLCGGEDWQRVHATAKPGHRKAPAKG